MLLISWVLVVFAGVAALDMGISVRRRETLALPGRRRFFVGIHELILPFDETRYKPEAEQYHRRAQRAFLAMLAAFLVAVVIAAFT